MAAIFMLTAKLLEGVIWGVTAMDGAMQEKIASLKTYREDLMATINKIDADIRQMAMLADENKKDIGKLNALLEELKK